MQRLFICQGLKCSFLHAGLLEPHKAALLKVWSTIPRITRWKSSCPACAGQGCSFSWHTGGASVQQSHGSPRLTGDKNKKQNPPSAHRRRNRFLGTACWTNLWEEGPKNPHLNKLPGESAALITWKRACSFKASSKPFPWSSGPEASQFWGLHQNQNQIPNVYLRKYLQFRKVDYLCLIEIF